ncbi:hypothetical protein EDB85DRAFT_2144557 [Lactarius pseudohatsudake]|nr:hypothetical protein EDB85DRAFT_2144557 [Lactarius pseudohatsudake]
MHAISTAAFVSVLALVSTLAQAMPQAIQKNAPTLQPSPAPSSSDKAVPCTNTYTVPQAEPCDTLVAKLGLSQADILSLNSGLSCKLTARSPLGKYCASRSQSTDLAPACKTKATATGKTCDDLASKFGLTPKKFAEYNDDVNSDCTNLVPGHTAWLSIDTQETQIQSVNIVNGDEIFSRVR